MNEKEGIIKEAYGKDFGTANERYKTDNDNKTDNSVTCVVYLPNVVNGVIFL